jgi:hypothetical protein
MVKKMVPGQSKFASSGRFSFYRSCLPIFFEVLIPVAVKFVVGPGKTGEGQGEIRIQFDGPVEVPNSLSPSEGRLIPKTASAFQIGILGFWGSRLASSRARSSPPRIPIQGRSPHG